MKGRGSKRKEKKLVEVNCIKNKNKKNNPDIFG